MQSTSVHILLSFRAASSTPFHVPTALLTSPLSIQFAEGSSCAGEQIPVPTTHPRFRAALALFGEDRPSK